MNEEKKVAFGEKVILLPEHKRLTKDDFPPEKWAEMMAIAAAAGLTAEDVLQINMDALEMNDRLHELCERLGQMKNSPPAKELRVIAALFGMILTSGNEQLTLDFLEDVKKFNLKWSLKSLFGSADEPKARPNFNELLRKFERGRMN